MMQQPPAADAIHSRHSSSSYDRWTDPIHVLRHELGGRRHSEIDGEAAADDIFLDLDLQALLSSPSPSDSVSGDGGDAVGCSNFHNDDDDDSGGGYFEFDGGVPAGHAVLSRLLQLDCQSVDYVHEHHHLPSMSNHPTYVPHTVVAACRNVKTMADMAVDRDDDRRCSCGFESSSGGGEAAGGYSAVNQDLRQRSNEATKIMAALPAMSDKPPEPVPSTTINSSAEQLNLRTAASDPAANRRLIAAAALANLNLCPAADGGGSSSADVQRKRRRSSWVMPEYCSSATSTSRPYGRRSWLSTTMYPDSAATAALQLNQRPQSDDNVNPPPYGGGSSASRSGVDADRSTTYAATTDHHHHHRSPIQLPHCQRRLQPFAAAAAMKPSPELQRTAAASSTTTTTSSSSITSACNGSNYAQQRRQQQRTGSAGRSHRLIRRNDEDEEDEEEEDSNAPIALRECSRCCGGRAAPPPITSALCGGGTAYDVPGGGGGDGGYGGARWAAREAAWTAAALEPLDWTELVASTARSRPKRRNVRISKDPQSVSARRRRERISDRIRVLQKLVPNATKMDTASMLDEALHYLQFLQAQVAAASASAATELAPPPAAYS